MVVQVGTYLNIMYLLNNYRYFFNYVNLMFFICKGVFLDEKTSIYESVWVSRYLPSYNGNNFHMVLFLALSFRQFDQISSQFVPGILYRYLSRQVCTYTSIQTQSPTLSHTMIMYTYRYSESNLCLLSLRQTVFYATRQIFAQVKSNDTGT